MLISDTGAFDFGMDLELSARSLTGKRVLVTGITSRTGIDIARSFVDAGARVILQCDEVSPVMQALAEMLAPDAAELSVHVTALASNEDILGFARHAVAEFGGLDMVVNVVELDGGAPQPRASYEVVEGRVSDVLLKACLTSRVAANRMRLMMKDGVVLTVATLSAEATQNERAFAQVVRSTLAAMTRAEAEAWASQGIRFYAVAPDVLGVVARPNSGCEADVAQLALYLATGHGSALSGQTFELGLLSKG
jgi:NAD(P)-dependent dehydrogenase (short-subunit alcohol dehydrogenase family)